MITLTNRDPNQRILELGGGANPVVIPTCMGGKDVNVDVRDCFTADGVRTTDFTANFDEQLPIADNDFDHIVCQYCLEHVSWRKVRQFISEMFRIVKSGGKVTVVTSNTQAQFEWILKNPEGWDGKDLFESASCVIYGDNDYPENTHRAFFTPGILGKLFADAGFAGIDIRPYGARDTDISVVATKPDTLWKGETAEIKTIELNVQKLPMLTRNPYEAAKVDERKKAVIGFQGVLTQDQPPFKAGEIVQQVMEAKEEMKSVAAENMPREEMFDKHYFNGGGKVGGYAAEGYRDFPVHEITFRHLMMRMPTSVLEIGAARGYIGKRLEDAKIPYLGLEISKHCWMTRVCNNIINMDVCKTPWGEVHLEKYDCSFSIATLEHIPEQFVPNVLRELGKRCHRHVHAIDFGDNDDGFDKTHCTLRSKEWWATQFSNAGLTNYEIVNKESFERWHDGQFPEEALKNKGNRLKLNVGCFTTMFHHGWVNIDVHDLGGWAGTNGYQYMRHDIRNPLPFNTGDVDYIFMSHFLEHLNPQEALNFLKECRRLLKPATGAMRIIVPDAKLLTRLYHEGGKDALKEYAEINDGVDKAKTSLQRLQALLYTGHQSFYDEQTMIEVLGEADFMCFPAGLRYTQVDRCEQILKETTEMGFELSLFSDAIPTLPSFRHPA